MRLSRLLLAGGALAIAAVSLGQASIGQTDTHNGRSNLVIRFNPTIAGVTYLPNQSFGYDGVTVDANGGPDRTGDILNTFGTNTNVTWDAVDTFAVNLSTWVDVMPFVWVQGNFDRQVYVQGIGNGSQSDVANIDLLTNVDLTITAAGADFDFMAPAAVPTNALKLDYLFEILNDSTRRPSGTAGTILGTGSTINTTAAIAPGTPSTGSFSQLLAATQTTQGWATLKMTRTLTVSIANGVVPPGTYDSNGTIRFALGL
jgi:hypothetical protein